MIVIETKTTGKYNYREIERQNESCGKAKARASEIINIDIWRRQAHHARSQRKEEGYTGESRYKLRKKKGNALMNGMGWILCIVKKQEFMKEE